jgi:predicted Mrr-cat superfamily restriction endonuclease
MNAYSINNRGKGTTSHIEAWNFYKSVEIGNLLLLYRKGKILAMGYVTGDYDYNEENVFDGEQYYHVRPTKWKALDVSKQKFSPHLINSLTKPSDTIHEIEKKEDILEVLNLVTKEFFFPNEFVR